MLKSNRNGGGWFETCYVFVDSIVLTIGLLLIFTDGGVCAFHFVEIFRLVEITSFGNKIKLKFDFRVTMMEAVWSRGGRIIKIGHKCMTCKPVF